MVLYGLLWSYMAFYGLLWPFCCVLWQNIDLIGIVSYFLPVIDPNSFGLVFALYELWAVKCSYSLFIVNFSSRFYHRGSLTIYFMLQPFIMSFLFEMFGGNIRKSLHHLPFMFIFHRWSIFKEFVSLKKEADQIKISRKAWWLKFGLVNLTFARSWDLYFLKVPPLGCSKLMLGNSRISIPVRHWTKTNSWR